ncbi:MAG: peptidoglycan-associated lipoprotein Pal [Acidobacteriota bacterium]
MRKSLYPLAVIALLLVGIAITGTGCHKKAGPTPATASLPAAVSESAPKPPTPTISLTASPSAVEKGQSSTLSWGSTNATEVTIDGGIGTVEASGSRTITPVSSTTYRATATGPGGVASAEARITVSAEAIAPAVIPSTERPLSDMDVFVRDAKDAFFDYDSYGLRDDARQALTDSARALKERSNIRITIEGHCDERGSEAYNLALGDKRANAAKDFLVSQGIDPARIDTITYGEEKPFAMGHDEASWQQNRRAHLVMR